MDGLPSYCYVARIMVKGENAHRSFHPLTEGRVQPGNIPMKAVSVSGAVSDATWWAVTFAHDASSFALVQVDTETMQATMDRSGTCHRTGL